MKSLAAVPLPVKLFFGLGVALILIAAVSSASKGMVGMAAMICWILVVLTLLTVHGISGFLTTVPIVGQLITWISAPVQPLSSSGHKLDTTGAAAAPDKTSRDKILAEALQKIDSLQGIDSVKVQLNREISSVVMREAKLGEICFGTSAPIVLLVFYGSAGTGKTALAQQLAPLYCGYDALKYDLAITVDKNDLFRGYGGGMEQVGEYVQRACGGVLILDNADWLVERNSSSDPMGIDFGRELLRCCGMKTDPQPVLVVATMSADAGYRLQQSEEHKAAWLNKVATHWFEFPALSTDILRDILERALASLSFSLDSSGVLAAENYIGELKRADGKQFSHSSAMHRLAEKLQRLAAADNRSSVSAEDFSTLRHTY